MKVGQSYLTLCDPMDYSLPGFSVHGILQARILEWVAIPFSSRSSQPRDQTQVSPLQVNSLLSEPPGKPKNTGVGSLSLLQQIFPTQKLNCSLLHCRRIPYHLNHQGSPRILEWVAYPFSRGIFPTQESNQGLLHCRWILYQLSYQGSLVNVI